MSVCSPPYSPRHLTWFSHFRGLTHVTNRQTDDVTCSIFNTSLHLTLLALLVMLTTHTTVLLLVWNLSGTTRVSRNQKGKTRKGKTNLDLLEQERVSGSGICWVLGFMQVCTSSQTTTPTSHHSVFLQAGCPSFRPTNSVKALKGDDAD